MRLIPIPLLGLLLLADIGMAAAPTPAAVAAQAPETAVRAFNAAISGRKLEAALATLAPGAVNFNLAPVHAFAAGQGNAQPLTSDLALHWRTIAPVVYASSRRFERRVEQATTHVDGALAVVWARVRTTTEPRNGSASTLSFSETYLLRFDEGEWRIAGMANARPTR